MNILTIDTSDRSIVGFVRYDRKTGVMEEIASEQAPDARHHAETLVPMVESVIADCRPDAIVVGTGPAAFTGLRAGLMTARALARAWNIPIYGVSSLEAIALGAADTQETDDALDGNNESRGEVVAAIDARRKELFVMRARARGKDDVEVVSGPLIISPTDLPVFSSGAGVVAASNPGLYPELAQAHNIGCCPLLLVRLAWARLARIEAGEEIHMDTQPQYLRRPDVHVK